MSGRAQKGCKEKLNMPSSPKFTIACQILARRIKERASEVIVGRVLMWLGKEFAREVIFGFIYAFIFNFIMQEKLPFLARSRESDQEIIQELTREIGQNLRVQQQSIQEDTVRRIIEESYRMRAPRAVQPPASTPYPQPAAPRTPYPTPVVQAYSEQLRSITGSSSGGSRP
jgi:hypothetical protein